MIVQLLCFLGSKPEKNTLCYADIRRVVFCLCLFTSLFVFSHQKNNEARKDSIATTKNLPVKVHEKSHIYVVNEASIWMGEGVCFSQGSEVVYLKTLEKQPQKIAKIQRAIKAKRLLCRLDKHKDTERKRYIAERAKPFYVFFTTESTAFFRVSLSFTKGIQASTSTSFVVISCESRNSSKIEFLYPQVRYLFFSYSDKSNDLMSNCFNRPPPFFV